MGATQFSYPHDSKYFSDSQKAGALFLEIEANRLDAFYLEEDSLIHDKFTILKNVNQHKNINTYSNQLVVLSASWNGTYNWSNNYSNTKSQIISNNSNSQFIVNDSLNCLADTFNLSVTSLFEIDNAKYFLIFGLICSNAAVKTSEQLMLKQN